MTPCDCLNDCGDDHRVMLGQCAKCEWSIAREAEQRAIHWQRFEAWWEIHGTPGMCKDSARTGWHAARKRYGHR